jgi:hypothetical protein
MKWERLRNLHPTMMLTARTSKTLSQTRYDRSLSSYTGANLYCSR